MLVYLFGVIWILLNLPSFKSFEWFLFELSGIQINLSQLILTQKLTEQKFAN